MERSSGGGMKLLSLLLAAGLATSLHNEDCVDCDESPSGMQKVTLLGTTSGQPGAVPKPEETAVLSKSLPAEFHSFTTLTPEPKKERFLSTSGESSLTEVKEKIAVILASDPTLQPKRKACPVQLTKLNTMPGKCQFLNSNSSIPVPSAEDNAGFWDGQGWDRKGLVMPSKAMLQNRVYNLGTTTIQFSIADEFQNIDYCDTIVSVEDKEPPTFSFMDLTGSLCGNVITANNEKGKCGATVMWEVPTVEDNCPNVVTVAPPSIHTGHFFPVSTSRSKVEYGAKDASGNAAVCGIEFIVNDSEPPTLTCPDVTLTLPSTTSTCTTTVRHNMICTYKDNCAGGVYTCDQHEFGLGTTKVSCTAIDAVGHKTLATAKVTVKDVTKPTITGIPKTITKSLIGEQTTAIVEWVPPTANDNVCGAVTCRELHGRKSGDTFGMGDHTISYVCTDISNLTSTADFSVRVDGKVTFSACPVAIRVPASEHSTNTAVDFGVKAVSLITGQSVPVTPDIPGVVSGLAFPVGTTTLGFTAKSLLGPVRCEFTLEVYDNTKEQKSSGSSLGTMLIEINVDEELSSSVAQTSSFVCPAPLHESDPVIGAKPWEQCGGKVVQTSGPMWNYTITSVKDNTAFVGCCDPSNSCVGTPTYRICRPPATPQPTPNPTAAPTPNPTTGRPTPEPTTNQPTKEPTDKATVATADPIAEPTAKPTAAVATPPPTEDPTMAPTPNPTKATAYPTASNTTGTGTGTNSTDGGSPDHHTDGGPKPTADPTLPPTGKPTTLPPTGKPTTSKEIDVDHLKTLSPVTSPTVPPTAAEDAEYPSCCSGGVAPRSDCTGLDQHDCEFHLPQCAWGPSKECDSTGGSTGGGTSSDPSGGTSSDPSGGGTSSGPSKNGTNPSFEVAGDIEYIFKGASDCSQNNWIRDQVSLLFRNKLFSLGMNSSVVVDMRCLRTAEARGGNHQLTDSPYAIISLDHSIQSERLFIASRSCHMICNPSQHDPESLYLPQSSAVVRLYGQPELTRAPQYCPLNQCSSTVVITNTETSNAEARSSTNAVAGSMQSDMVGLFAGIFGFILITLCCFCCCCFYRKRKQAAPIEEEEEDDRRFQTYSRIRAGPQFWSGIPNEEHDEQQSHEGFEDVEVEFKEDGPVFDPHEEPPEAPLPPNEGEAPMVHAVAVFDDEDDNGRAYGEVTGTHNIRGELVLNDSDNEEPMDGKHSDMHTDVRQDNKHVDNSDTDGEPLPPPSQEMRPETPPPMRISMSMGNLMNSDDEEIGDCDDQHQTDSRPETPPPVLSSVVEINSDSELENSGSEEEHVMI